MNLYFRYWMVKLQNMGHLPNLCVIMVILCPVSKKVNPLKCVCRGKGLTSWDFSPVLRHLILLLSILVEDYDFLNVCIVHCFAVREEKPEPAPAFL